MQKSALTEFGRVVMERVRDQAIKDGEMLIDGQWKDPRCIALSKALGNLTPEQRDVLLQLVTSCVDATLHHFLWMLDQEEWIDVAVRTEDETVASLREVSDGLVGDKVTWIDKFSKYPPSV